MILSGDEISKRVIKDKSKLEDIYNFLKEGRWDLIGDSIVIDPFDPDSINICSYDLSVGEEYVSLRNPSIVRRLQEGELIKIEPGETILILTREYIALPPNITGLVVPRARMIARGTMINATRIDPTWHGKLLIGFTNLLKYPISLSYGEKFCACIFMECSKVDKPLTKRETPHLGRVRIEPLHPAILPEDLLPPEKVTWEDLDYVVKTFRKPWDIAQGIIKKSMKETQDWIEKEIAPNIAERAALSAYERSYKELIRLLQILIGFIGGLFTVIIAYLLKMIGII
jgi:deoxycytidine triphosphate deaminase